jgi:hypothetical protein
VPVVRVPSALTVWSKSHVTVPLVALSTRATSDPLGTPSTLSVKY